MAFDGATPGDEIHKSNRHGTHRSVAPTETLARVGPLMAEMGITRIANITGLDCIGVPVVMVCRPNSRSIAVSQGKGLDLGGGQGLRLMEAVETYHAETIDLPLKLGSYRRARPHSPAGGRGRAPARQGRAAITHDQPAAVDRGPGPASATVAALGAVRARSHRLHVAQWPRHGCFRRQHQRARVGEPHPRSGEPRDLRGGRAGRHQRCGSYAPAETVATARSISSTVDDDACRWVLDRFERADIAVQVWDTTSDVGIAVVQLPGASGATTTAAAPGVSVRGAIPCEASLCFAR